MRPQARVPNPATVSDGSLARPLAERSRERGMKQFLDEKAYRPGLESFRRET